MATHVGRQLLPASTIEGTGVQNAAGEDLGEINELMIDLEKGRIAYAVLSFGGFLGLGDKLFAIPWGSPQHRSRGGCVYPQRPPRKTGQRSRLRQGQLAGYGRCILGETLHTYYGYKPYW